MNMNKKRIPWKVSPPGRILRLELEARGWTQKDLAAIMGRPEQAISEIINAEKQITPQTAIELSKAFGTSPEFWINLEANYQLWLAARQEEPKPIERNARLYSLAPVSELKRLGWLPDTDGIDKLERAYLDLMAIPSLDRTPSLAVSLRKSGVKDADSRHQAIWIKRVEQLVRDQRVGRFALSSLKKAIPRLLQYSEKTDGAVDVPRFLMRLGIRFALVPHLSKTYLDGAVFRLDGNPVVALTLRYDRLDCFWFTLMHELAHLVAGHQGAFLETIYDRQGPVRRDETAADKLARDWLVDPEKYGQFVDRTRPYFTGRKIREFAGSIGRHPAIVLGRLQFDGEVGSKSLRSLLDKVKPVLRDFYDKPIPT
jgi:HTH-type transcriptional regulator/antitoxin HigA